MNTKVDDNQIKQQIINQSDQIDLVVLWHTLIQDKLTIIKITGFFTILGFLYAFFATPYFQSTISLYPAGEIAKNNSHLQGLAESFGIGGLGQSPTYSIPDIINSRRLKKDVVLKSWTNNDYPNGSNLIQYWDIDKKMWFSQWSWLYKLLPSTEYPGNPHHQYIEDAIEDLSKLILVDEGESGLITVSVLMQEPELAADIANYIAEFVKDFILVSQHREAEKNKTFIYGQKIQAKEELALSEEKLTKFRKLHPIALDSPELQLRRGRFIRDIETNQAVYITLRQQYEIAKIEAAKENLLINILDIAEPAVKNEIPRRKLIIILSFIMGGLIGMAAIVLRNTVKPK